MAFAMSSILPVKFDTIPGRDCSHCRKTIFGELCPHKLLTDLLCIPIDLQLDEKVTVFNALVGMKLTCEEEWMDPSQLYICGSCEELLVNLFSAHHRFTSQFPNSIIIHKSIYPNDFPNESEHGSGHPEPASTSEFGAEPTVTDVETLLKVEVEDLEYSWDDGLGFEHVVNDSEGQGQPDTIQAQGADVKVYRSPYVSIESSLRQLADLKVKEGVEHSKLFVQSTSRSTTATTTSTVKKHPCFECGKRFLSPYHLNRHRKVHGKLSRDAEAQVTGQGDFQDGPQKKFICEVSGCRKVFRSAYHLKRHGSFHKRRLHFGFSDLNQNQDNNASESQSLDNQSLGASSRRIPQNRSRSTTSRKYMCLACGKLFPSPYHLRRHSRTHKNVPFLQTPEVESESDGRSVEVGLYIPEPVPDALALAQAAYSENSDSNSNDGPQNSKKYKCMVPGCGKDFRSPYHLKRHMNFHTRRGYEYDPVLLESDNSESFMTSSLMKYKCLVCGKHFRSPYHLRRHSRIHRVIMDPPPSQDDFQITQQSNNSESTESVEAPILDLMAAQDEQMTSYLCTKCGRELKNKKDLRMHMRTHQDKSIQCEECGKAFFTIHELKSHSIAHSDLRPFMCEICGQGAKSKANLDKHMRTHNNEKSHKCPFPTCTSGFAFKYNLNKHIAKVHKYDREKIKGPLSSEILGPKVKQGSS